MCILAGLNKITISPHCDSKNVLSFFFCFIATSEVSLSFEGLSFDSCENVGQPDVETASQRELGAV